MYDKNDSLEQLLGGFLDEAEARAAAADIRRGDLFWNEYPAPQPDTHLLKEIKAKVGDSLGAAAARRRVYSIGRVAAAAAVIVIASVLLLWPGPQSSFAGHEGIWDDKAITSLRAEIDAVLDTMISISADEYGFDEAAGDFAEAELEELEMVAMNDDFWKG